VSIQLLLPEVASQIAAGEVIERPASVVKELLENALDAGADFIQIKVEGAGQRLVETADNGCGIPADEIALAVERHATSKLSKSEDLFQIKTLGFRGEALASIGSVSRLTLTSRTESAETGMRLRVEAGVAKGKEPVGVPPGTVVRVEDLFFNVPARRKFLKHETTERRVIDELVTRYALAYPKVRFHLYQEGRVSLQTSGKGERREIARQMLEVISRDEWLKVTGFISPPAVTRSNRRDISLFVNGRPVQDASLMTALLKAYHTLLMVGRYPLGIVFLELPSEAVDVNVHPTKAEVRFREPDKIFTGIQRAIRQALLAHTSAPGLDLQVRWSADPVHPSVSWNDQAGWSRGQSEGAKAGSSHFPGDVAPPEPAGSYQVDSPRKASPPGASTPILRLVGQIATTYLVAEGPDGLYLIDQHAAHERVLFEKMMAQAGESSVQIAAQSLLQPVTVSLPPASARLLLDQLPFLRRYGFEVELFGTNTFLVRSVPALFAGSDPSAALRVLVEEFEEDETPLKAQTEARLVARICKRAAVKGGQVLSMAEQKALLQDLEACQQPRTCPHGRPTMIHLSVDLLERQFGRRGAR
jgi:DNA mismatch repair protein MutL